MKRLLILAFALIPNASWAFEIFADWSAWGYAEPVSIYQYSHDWEGKLEKGRDAFLFERRTLGYRQGNWSLARTSQKIYMVEPNRDSVRLYHRVQNKNNFSVGERFELDIKLDHYSTRGIQLGYRFELAPGYRITPRLNLWKTYHFLDGRIQGEAVAIAARDYDYQINVDYRYSSDPLFDRQVEQPSGSGYSLDIEAVYEISDDTRLLLVAYDLLSELKWSDAPVTTGNATSNTKSFDGDGFVQFRPVLQGFEGEQKLDTKLPYRVNATVEHQINNKKVSSSVLVTPLQWFWQLRFGIEPIAGLDIGLLALPVNSAVGLQLQWHGFQFAWVADDFDTKEARYLQLHLGYSYQF